MAAGWFCEKSGWIWESGGCETGAFKKQNRIPIGIHFEEEDFFPD